MKTIEELKLLSVEELVRESSKQWKYVKLIDTIKEYKLIEVENNGTN